MSSPKPGTGQGQGKPRRGEGGRDLCVCPNPKCGQIHRHPRGSPCTDFICIKCGTELVGST